MRLRNFFLYSLAFIALAGGAPLFARQVFPGEGVNFSQFDLAFPEDYDVENSPYGLAVADYASISASTGISSGFLNIYNDALGWIVQNMPIDAASGYPGLGTVFDLRISSDISSLAMYVDVSRDPSSSFFPPEGASYPSFYIENRLYNASGSVIGIDENIAPLIPADPVIAFQAGGLLSVNWQSGHPNIEQEINQCGPAAVANSLQWLEDKYGLEVKPEHAPGLLDDTLVGELDKKMKRLVNDPVRSAKDFIDGKLGFIDSSGLYRGLNIKHKSRPGVDWLADIEVVGSAKSTANKDPNLSFIDWIISEIRNGENVEVRIGMIGGKDGHYIDLIGGGYILGVPWLAWVHDTKQGIPGGTTLWDYGYAFSLIKDNTISIPLPQKNSILPKFKKGSIDYAVSESVPTPLPVIGVGIALRFARKLRRLSCR